MDGISSRLEQGGGEARTPAPATRIAIQACLTALAAEAFECGHDRAAQVLAQVAALMAEPTLWDCA